MGPTWGRQDPVRPHVGPMNLAIRDSVCDCTEVQTNTREQTPWIDTSHVPQAFDVRLLCVSRDLMTSIWQSKNGRIKQIFLFNGNICWYY